MNMFMKVAYTVHMLAYFSIPLLVKLSVIQYGSQT